MPTPEEIKKIAREYAEYMCPVGDYCGGVYDDQRNTDLPIYKDDAKSVLEWLSERYCLVEKSKVKEWEGIVEDALKADPVITEPAFRFMWERLFNEEKG